MEANDLQVKLAITECEKDLANTTNRLCGMIRRSFSFMDGEMFKTLFKSLVRPLLEYGNTVWSPWYVKDVQLIENVQRRASKLVEGLQDLGYEERLQKLMLPSLVYRRLQGDLIQVHKYMHNHYDTESMFFIDEGSRTRGHTLKLVKEHCRKDVRKKFFSLRVNSLWNKLPSNVVSADTLNSVKSRLDALFGDKKYSCSKEDILSTV